MRNIPFLITAVLLMAGCAGVQVNKVTSDSQEGIRFYRPHPYLLVTREKVEKPATPEKPTTPEKQTTSEKPTTPKKSATSKKSAYLEKPDTAGSSSAAAPPADKVTTYIQIIWLPDKSENYAIRTKSGLGTVDSTIKLDNGWQLTQFGGKVDTKIPEAITAASGFLQALVKAMAVPGIMVAPEVPRPEKVEILPPGLYRLEFNEKGFVTEIVPVTLSKY